MTILNLTQHAATADQLAAGVVDLAPAVREDLKDVMTFDALPTTDQLSGCARYVACLAYSAAHRMDPIPSEAMIGGAPYFMRPLENALLAVGLRPVYAFSIRESEEVTQPDGTVRKVNVFRHGGFVEPYARQIGQCSP